MKLFKYLFFGVVALSLILLASSCDLTGIYTSSNYVEEIHSERLGALGIEVGDDITRIKYLKDSLYETKYYADDGMSYRTQKHGTIYATGSGTSYRSMTIRTGYDSNSIQVISLRRNSNNTTMGEFKYRIFEKFGNDCGGEFNTRGSTRWPDAYWIYWNGYVDSIKVSVEYYQSSDYNLVGSKYDDFPSLTMNFGEHVFDY